MYVTPRQGPRLTASRCHRHDFAVLDVLIFIPATLRHPPGCHNFKLENI